jgi:hypothetical protein
MGNRRVYYAIEQVGIKAIGHTGAYESSMIVHGVQSVGIDTTFNVDYLVELGQIDTYASMENRPDVKVTIERLLDGTPLAYHLATTGASNSLLGSRTVDPCVIGFGIYPDSQTVASGTPVGVCQISGAYIDSLSYTLNIDGNFTENVGFVANDKTWGTSDVFDYNFDGSDAPANKNAAVSRRWNVVMGSSTWPSSIPGLSSDGTNIEIAGSGYGAHLQTVTISTTLGRTDMNELGRKSPYYRYANYPVDVTCAIQTNTSKGDFVDAAAEEINLQNDEIDIYVADDDNAHAIHLNLGTKNKLDSVNQGGGDTGGGPLTATYNYKNKNTLTITSDDDPATGIAL